MGSFTKTADEPRRLWSDRPSEVEDQDGDKPDEEEDAKSLKLGFALNEGGVLEKKDDNADQKTRHERMQEIRGHRVSPSYWMERSMLNPLVLPVSRSLPI